MSDENETTTISREVADIIRSIADNHRSAGRIVMALLAEEELRRCEVVDD